MAGKEMTVAAAAAALGLAAVGDVERVVSGVAQPDEARASELALAMDPKYLPKLAEGEAKAAVTPPDIDLAEYGLEAAIFAPRPRLAMAGLTALFAHQRQTPLGAHATAVIDPSADIDPTASIGAYAVIGPAVRIGAGSVVMSAVTIGDAAEIGADCLMHPGVRIGERVRIGARCIIHSGAVIGSDGFSFVTPEPGSVESAKASGVVAEGAENRKWVRIASLGSVWVGDDVEIGANTTIDRGTIRDTRIGDGAKIDNLVQIGHNVVIGENSLLCGQSGVAGSSEVGARVVIGGQSGVGDHSAVGDDAVIMASSGASGVVRPRTVVGGTPALPRDQATKQVMSLRRLPRALEDLAELKNRFSKIEPSG